MEHKEYNLWQFETDQMMNIEFIETAFLVHLIKILKFHKVHQVFLMEFVSK